MFFKQDISGKIEQAKAECEDHYIKREKLTTYKVFDEFSKEYCFGGYFNENFINILMWGAANTLIPFYASIGSQIYIPFTYDHKMGGWSKGKLVYSVKEKDLNNNSITLQGPIHILDHEYKP